jgi:hypothetical protein
MKISLSDYIDFISKSGLQRLTKVNGLLGRPSYHPSTDFYKSIREEIVEQLKEGGGKDQLNTFLEAFTHSKKYSRFQPLVKGYLKFLGKKKIEWFKPPVSHWNYKSLSVRMNPELGIGFDDQKYIIKLYFKSVPLQKTDVEILLWMMNQTLANGIFSGYKCALLDVERSKLHYQNKFASPISALIEGEAESFIKIWEGLERKSA